MASKAAKELIAQARMEAGIIIGEARGIQKGEASGFEKGEASGLRKGAVTGEAKQLIRQMEYRFGQLSESLRIRIEHASLSEIEDWSLRVLDAKSLSDVLVEAA